MNTSDPNPPLTRQLLDRARKGDEVAASSLFANVLGRLETYVHARLGDRLRARLQVDDVVQETLLKALTALPEFEDRGPGTLSGWLCRIAENVIRNLAEHHGAARRTPVVEAGRVSRILATARASVAGPATLAAGSDDGRALRSKLDSLPEELRVVILMRHFEGRTIDEIAAATDSSASAVRRALGRAVRDLGQGLGGQS